MHTETTKFLVKLLYEGCDGDKSQMDSLWNEYQHKDHEDEIYHPVDVECLCGTCGSCRQRELQEEFDQQEPLNLQAELDEFEQTSSSISDVSDFDDDFSYESDTVDDDDNSDEDSDGECELLSESDDDDDDDDDDDSNTPSKFVISVAPMASRKAFRDSRYEQAKNTSIISVCVVGKHPTEIQSEKLYFSPNRIEFCERVEIGDIVYIKNAKNPRKALYCKGTVVSSFEEIKDISKSQFNEDKIRELLSTIGDEHGILRTSDFFDSMIYYERQCNVKWEKVDVKLKNSEYRYSAWHNLHQPIDNENGTVRKMY